MCTVVILRRPGADWPLIVGANRDEMRDRAWDAPERHWPDRPQVRAGRDRLAKGSWLGLNDTGVAAMVLNRTGSLGPFRDRRSRGELVLDALSHDDAASATETIAARDASDYGGFNLVIADAENAWWLAGKEAREIKIAAIPEGLSMLASTEINDRDHPRINAYLPRFANAAAPNPECGDWSDWAALLADPGRTRGSGSESAMYLDGGHGYGTVSSTLLALPADAARAPEFLFAPGRPTPVSYTPVAP